MQKPTEADRRRMKEMANLRLGNDLIKKYIEQGRKIVSEYEQEYNFVVPGKKRYEIADAFAHSIAGHLVGWQSIDERLTVEQAEENIVFALSPYYHPGVDDEIDNEPRLESDIEADWAGITGQN